MSANAPPAGRRSRCRCAQPGTTRKRSDSPADVLRVSASGFLFSDFQGGLAFYTPAGTQLASTQNSNTTLSEILPASALGTTALGTTALGTTANPLLQDLLNRTGSEPVFSPPFADPRMGELYVLVAASAGNEPVAVGAFSATTLARHSLADVFTPGDPTAAFVVDAAHQVIYQIEQTMADLRRFTRALRPIYLEDLGLVAPLEMLAREVSQANSLQIEFHRAGSERRLSPEVELALYRMAQEALSNVARHAQASRASLNLAFKREAVALMISDDGRGFQVLASPTELAPGGHFGLLSLHERTELIAARLNIQSSPGQGMRVVVRLPLSNSAPFGPFPHKSRLIRQVSDIGVSFCPSLLKSSSCHNASPRMRRVEATGGKAVFLYFGQAAFRRFCHADGASVVRHFHGSECITRSSRSNREKEAGLYKNGTRRLDLHSLRVSLKPSQECRAVTTRRIPLPTIAVITEAICGLCCAN
jgi:two-component sensor histidine kinase